MSKITATRGALQSALKSMCGAKELYVGRPGVSFTWHCTLDFGTLRKELLDYFSYAPTAPPVLVKKREDASRGVPVSFPRHERKISMYKGIQLAAYPICDGTYLPIAPDPDDNLTCVFTGDSDGKAYVLLTLTVRYDSLESRYTNLWIGLSAAGTKRIAGRND